MAALGPEWMLWAKKLQDKHVSLVNDTESLSRTVQQQGEEINSGVVAAQEQAQEIVSLRSELSSLKTEHADEIAALKEQLHEEVASIRLELDSSKSGHGEEVAALRDEVRALSEVWTGRAQTVHASQLTRSNLASVDPTIIGVPYLRSYCEKKAQNARNHSAQAQLHFSDPADDRDDLANSSHRPRRFPSIPSFEASSNDSISSDERDNSRQGRRDLLRGLERLSSITQSEVPSNDTSKHVFPVSTAYMRPTSVRDVSPPVVALEPQRDLFLVEYLIRSEDDLRERQSTYEKKFVEAFMAGMEDEGQKTKLRSKLEDGVWTWKMVSDGVEEILNETDQQEKKTESRPSLPRKANGRFKRQRRR